MAGGGVGEVGPTIIKKRFGRDLEGRQLMRVMKEDLKGVTKSFLVELAEQEGQKWADQLIKVVDEIKAVGDFYYPAGVFGVKNEFKELLKGIKITERINTNDPERFLVKNIEFD